LAYEPTRTWDRKLRSPKTFRSHNTTAITTTASTLAKMVENPPLPADAAPTPENIQKWKDWWARNKDTARFVKMPPFE
jgi:hypothetical protein